jgi:hypothetical protein
MGSFNFYDGIKEDFASMIEEIGTEVSIEVPKIIADSYGNHVETRWELYEEIVWVTQNNEVMDIQGVGQLNRDDIRFVARHDTNIVIESKITYNDRTYIVLVLDRAAESGEVTTYVGYAKRELT